MVWVEAMAYITQGTTDPYRRSAERRHIPKEITAEYKIEAGLHAHNSNG